MKEQDEDFNEEAKRLIQEKEFNESIQNTLNGLVDLSQKEFTKEIIKPKFL
jgi:hypothetical protein